MNNNGRLKIETRFLVWLGIISTLSGCSYFQPKYPEHCDYYVNGTSFHCMPDLRRDLDIKSKSDEQITITYKSYMLIPYGNLQQANEVAEEHCNEHDQTGSLLRAASDNGTTTLVFDCVNRS